MTSPALRARYLNDSVATAPPERLLVMLYERLLLDLAQGEAALRADDRAAAGRLLPHAQEIIMELRSSLKMDVWDGAAGLAALYDFMITELITANVKGDADKVATCKGLVEPLLDAWRQAAMSAAPQPVAARVA